MAQQTPSWSFSGQNPTSIKGTLKSFKSLQAYFDFYNDITLTDIPISHGSGTYLGLWRSNEGYFADKISSHDVGWYGEPFPNSVQDGLSRTSYLDMADYNNVYKQNIEPRIQEILKKSSADLEMPTLRYNDLGLGSFDFNKASTGLIALYKYYSFKKKGLVEGKDVETYKQKDKYKYKLKSDGTSVVLVPEVKGGYDTKEAQKFLKEVEKGENVFIALNNNGLKIGGKEAFTSTIKKSYILKEKMPKPKNAIRLFVKMGNAARILYPDYKWTGYTAIGIAQLLEIMGYAVSIIGIVPIGNSDSTYPTRYNAINLKPFEETLDSQSLLYTISDPTFFRMKVFENIIKSAQYYKDYIDDRLGNSLEINEIKQIVYSEFGKRDKLYNDKGKSTNSEFLYYIIADVYNVDELNSTILNIGLDVVNENKQARLNLLGI